MKEQEEINLDLLTPKQKAEYLIEISEDILNNPHSKEEQQEIDYLSGQEITY